MNRHEKLFCNYMADFIDSHYSNIKKSNEFLGIPEREQFIREIRKDKLLAGWCLIELCGAYMDKDYFSELVIGDNETPEEAPTFYVVKIGSKYIKISYSYVSNKTICVIEPAKLKTKKIQYWE